MKLTEDQKQYLKDLLVWVRHAANDWADEDKYPIAVTPLFDICEGIRISDIRSTAGKKGGRPPKNPKKVEKVAKPVEKPVEKKKYAEYVELFDSEYDELVQKYGSKIASSCVLTLNNYKHSSGKKYKSDYGAINVWVLDKVLEKAGLTKETAHVKLAKSTPTIQQEPKAYPSMEF